MNRVTFGAPHYFSLLGLGLLDLGQGNKGLPKGDDMTDTLHIRVTDDEGNLTELGAAIRTLQTLKPQKTDITNAYKDAAEIIRAALVAAGKTKLRDGRNALLAEISLTKPTPKCDLTALKAQKPEIFAELVEAGIIKIEPSERLTIK